MNINNIQMIRAIKFFTANIILLSAIAHAANNNTNLSLYTLVQNYDGLISGVIFLLIVLWFIAIHIYDNHYIVYKSIHKPIDSDHMPKEVIKFIKIRILNTQNIPVNPKFQQKITFSLYKYKKYLPLYFNILFLDQNHKPIYSWLENPDAKNMNYIYWLLLENGLQQSSGIDIYVAFIEKTSNKYSKYIGALQSNGAQLLDNGNIIFDLYKNFKTGIDTTFEESNDVQYELKNYGIKITQGALFSKNPIYNPSEKILESCQTFSYKSKCIPSCIALSSSKYISEENKNNDSIVMFLANKKDRGINIQAFAADGTKDSDKFNIQSNMNLINLKSPNTIILGILSTGEQIIECINYELKFKTNAIINRAHYIIIGSAEGILSQKTDILPLTIYWIRTRQIPPNNIMPIVSIIDD